MKAQFSIADAQSDIKALNDYLKCLGDKINDRSVDFSELVALMTNPEFLRLMQNVQFFASAGNAHLATIYSNLAKAYEAKADAAS